MENMRTRIRDPDDLPRLALFGFLAVVVGLSTVGWIATVPGPAGWLGAGVSAVNEVLIFYGLSKLLQHAAEARWDRFGALILVLLLAAPVSIVGVDQGIKFAAQVVQAPLDEQARQEQKTRTEARAALQAEINAIRERIRAIDSTMPDAATTNTSRQQEWKNNRDTATAIDRERLPKAEAELAALPETVPARQAFPEDWRHAAAAMLFLLSAIGRFAWGFEAAPKAPITKRNEEPEGENVIDWETERSKRSTCNVPEGTDWNDERTAMAKQLKAEGLSLRKIAGQLGVSHTTIRRKLNA